MSTHRMYGTFTYKTWDNMKQRCFNKGNKGYSNYGGRGIGVCKRWMSFENFLEDMGKKPKGMSIERRNNNRGYSLENCYWATQSEQSRNRRNTRKITFQGKTLCLADWADKIGINRASLWYRLYRYNWTIDRALTLKKKGIYDNKTA